MNTAILMRCAFDSAQAPVPVVERAFDFAQAPVPVVERAFDFA